MYAHMPLPPISAHAHGLSLSPVVTVSPLWSLRMAHFLINGHPGLGRSPAFLCESLNVIVSLWFFPYTFVKEPQMRNSGCHHSPRYPNSYTTWMSKRPHQSSCCSLRLSPVLCPWSLPPLGKGSRDSGILHPCLLFRKTSANCVTQASPCAGPCLLQSSLLTCSFSLWATSLALPEIFVGLQAYIQ